MSCGSCWLIPLSGLVPEVVCFKTTKAIRFVIILVVAFDNRGQRFLASSTHSSPLILLMTRGALGGGSLGLALFPITTVVSPIASAVNWWDLSSSPVAWGGSAACSRGHFWGGTLVPTDLGADDVLTRVKLLPGKLATICSTLSVWMGTATQWWHIMFLLKKLQEQEHLPLFRSCTLHGSDAPLSTKKEPIWNPSYKPLLWMRAFTFFERVDSSSLENWPSSCPRSTEQLGRWVDDVLEEELDELGVNLKFLHSL